MATKSVIVYGASGYTGRLVCEYLREYNVPFVAAGRDESRLKTSMESHVARQASTTSGPCVRNGPTVLQTTDAPANRSCSAPGSWLTWTTS